MESSTWYVIKQRLAWLKMHERGDSVIVLCLTGVQCLEQGSKRRVGDISVEGTDAAGRFRRVPNRIDIVGSGSYNWRLAKRAGHGLIKS